MTASKSRSGRTLTEEERRVLGQTRVRLTAPTVDAVKRLALTGESRAATLERIVLEKLKKSRV